MGDITSKVLVKGSRAWHGGATGTRGRELGQEERPGEQAGCLTTACRRVRRRGTSRSPTLLMKKKSLDRGCREGRTLKAARRA